MGTISESGDRYLEKVTDLDDLEGHSLCCLLGQDLVDLDVPGHQLRMVLVKPLRRYHLLFNQNKRNSGVLLNYSNDSPSLQLRTLSLLSIVHFNDRTGAGIPEAQPHVDQRHPQDSHSTRISAAPQVFPPFSTHFQDHEPVPKKDLHQDILHPLRHQNQYLHDSQGQDHAAARPS